jgi:hypothetical protein
LMLSSICETARYVLESARRGSGTTKWRRPFDETKVKRVSLLVTESTKNYLEILRKLARANMP